MAKFLKSSIAAAALLAVTGLANALTVYSLNVAAKPRQLGPGPYGQVSLLDGVDDGTNGVWVTVDLAVSPAPGFNFVQTGGGAPTDFFFGFNLTQGSVKAGTISLANALGDTLAAASGAFTAPSFSTYNTVIYCSDDKKCNNGASQGGYSDPLKFFVSGASESSFGSAFVADVFGNGFTGWVGTTAPIPEPETYALMLAGLGAVGFMARRRKAAIAVPKSA